MYILVRFTIVKLTDITAVATFPFLSRSAHVSSGLGQQQPGITKIEPNNK